MKSFFQHRINRQVRALAGPMIVIHVLQTLFNVVDLLWIGQLGTKPLAGVSWASNILMALVTLIVGIATGTTAIVARNVGAKDHQEASRVAAHALVLGSLAASIVAAVGYIYIEQALILMGAELDVAGYGAEYLKIIFLGSVPLFLLYLLSAIFQGTKEIRYATQATVVATCLNFVLDPLMIFGFGPVPAMGVSGAAWATVISRSLAVIIALYALAQKSKLSLSLDYFKLNGHILWRILRIGVPGSLQMMLRSMVSIVVLVIAGQFGYQAVATLGIGLKLFNLAMMPGFGLGAAAAVLVGQHLGAKRHFEAMQSALIAIVYNAIIMQLIAIGYRWFAPVILPLFTKDPIVIYLCKEYLAATTIPYAFIGAGFVAARALNGAGDTFSNMVINLLCLWFLQIPLVLFYAFFWNLGVLGVWWGIMASSFLQALATLMWFAQGRWKEQKV